MGHTQNKSPYQEFCSYVGRDQGRVGDTIEEVKKNTSKFKHDLVKEFKLYHKIVWSNHSYNLRSEEIPHDFRRVDRERSQRL